MFDVKAKKIPIGGGFHRWHYENSSFQSSARKLVVQLYLILLRRVVKLNFCTLIKESKQNKVH